MVSFYDTIVQCYRVDRLPLLHYTWLVKRLVIRHFLQKLKTRCGWKCTSFQVDLCGTEGPTREVVITSFQAQWIGIQHKYVKSVRTSSKDGVLRTKKNTQQQCSVLLIVLHYWQSTNYMTKYEWTVDVIQLWCLLWKQSLVIPEKFQHILRVMNTNIDGRRKVAFALTAIKVNV